jgi:hypothetical protein
LAQYQHDRFAKLYIQALYQSKGRVEKNVAVIKDEDLEIDILPVTEITPEEQELMKTLEEIDAFLENYPGELLAAEQLGKQQGKVELAKTMIRAKFGAKVLQEAAIDQLQQLNATELDTFTTLIFQWQSSTEMLTWLEAQLALGIER